MNYGHLAIGNEIDQNKAIRITEMPKILSTSSGYSHTLFLDINNKVWSCGNNDDGQLGHNNTTSLISPKIIEGIPVIKYIIGGGHNSYLIDEEANVLSFGHNGSGQLGHGDTTNKIIPTQIQSLPKN